DRARRRSPPRSRSGSSSRARSAGGSCSLRLSPELRDELPDRPLPGAMRRHSHPRLRDADEPLDVAAVTLDLRDVVQTLEPLMSTKHTRDPLDGLVLGTAPRALLLRAEDRET